MRPNRQMLAALAIAALATPTHHEGRAQGEEASRKELDSRFWADIPDGTVVRPCEPESGDARAAVETLQDLDERILELDPGDDHTAIARAILDVLRTPCFRMAMEVDRLPRPHSAESLKRWWNDGGDRWLASYIELPSVTINGHSTPQIVIPPDDRPTLSPDSDRVRRLGAFLCAADDEDCRSETRGWRRRAESAIERLPDSRHIERLDRDVDIWIWKEAASHEVVANAVETACADADGRSSSYQRFRACAESVVTRRPVLPLGATRAPTSGWLLVAGRRGHYEYCDEVSAYNLANGDAFRARRCSGLVLEQGGAVDFPETERRATEALEVGFVNRENLREAAWMLWMIGEIEELRPRATYVDLPRGIERQLTKGARETEQSVGGVGWSSAQTTLIWSLTDPDFGTDGEMVWPFSMNRAEEHTARLLEIAEESWQRACPDGPPSTSELNRLFPGVNDRDADIDAFQATVQRLKGTIAAWSPVSCRDSGK